MCYYPKLRITLDHSDRYKVWDYDLFKPPLAKGWNKKNRAYVIDSRDEEYLKKLFNCYGQSIAQDIQHIPCGQCLDCRIKKKKELAQRALAESTLHEENYFVTLTYDDANLPYAYCFPPEAYKPGLYPVLNKSDFQTFESNLREYVRYHFNGTKIRIFYCGEYGEIGKRPHFHAIIYNLPLKNSLKPYKYFSTKNKKHMSYETSDIIDKCWKKGLAIVAPITWETCAYVAGYVTKKMIGRNKEEYLALCEAVNVAPQPLEFHQTPKRPGLGLEYFEQNIEAIYKNDKIVLPNGFEAKPCSYYDSKYDVLFPEDMAAIKEARKYKASLYESASFVEFAIDHGLNPKSETFFEDCERLKLDKAFDLKRTVDNNIKERLYKKKTRKREI